MTTKEDLLHHAICTLPSGIGDFRRKKHEKLCTAFPTPLPKAGLSTCVDLSIGKRMETAAIQVFVGFYKKRSKP